MKSLKMTIEFKAPVGSSLHSDTIFGQFCWEYMYIKGEDVLKKALDGFETSPFIVFSDGFFKDTVSMPFLKPKNLKEMKNFFEKNKSKDYDYYSQIKKLKKSKFVKIDSLWIDKEKINIFDLHDFIEDVSGSIKSANFIRNSVNRVTNTVENGLLYPITEVFYGKQIDIYVKFNDEIIDKDTISEIFESIGKFGFGRDKSTGKGRFKVVDMQENPTILEKKDKTAFISLSSFVPDSDCEVLYGKTFTKFGKHGGDLVFGNPFKNPVILFKSGSVFKVKEKKDIYGVGLNLSSYSGHYHNAYTIPLFVDVEE